MSIHLRFYAVLCALVAHSHVMLLQPPADQVGHLGPEPYTLYCQTYSLVCIRSHMNLSDITFLIHRVSRDVSPPFAAIAAPTLLGRPQV